MTNSTFTKFSGQSFNKSHGVFAKITWVFLMLFAFSSFKAGATITVASFPDTLKHHSYCVTSPQLILPVVATSNCSGGGSLAYQWYRGGATFSASTAITTGGSPTFSGFTTSTMIIGTPANLQPSDTFWVTVTETSGGCSQTVILGKMIYDRVSTKPVVSLVPTSPYSNNVCELEVASFTATQTSPTGYDLRTFKWYKKRVGGPDSLVKTDTTSLVFSSIYSFTTALNNDKDTIRVSVTNACGTTDTTPIVLTVNPKPIATVITSNIGVCQGTSFSVVYNVSNAKMHSNSGSADVDWRVKYSGDADLYNLLASTGTGNGNVTAVIPGGTLAPGTYTTTISNITNISSAPDSCTRNLTSQTITVIVYPEPAASFSSTASTSTPDTVKVCYQGAAKSMDLTVSNATYTNGGSVAVNWTVYYRQVSRNVSTSCAATANANLTRSAGTHLNSTSGTVTGTGNQVYNYVIPSSLQPGVYTYYIDSVVNTSNNCRTVTSSKDTMVIVVDPSPTITVSPSAASICQTDSVQFNIIAANAQYCAGATLTNADWSLAFTSNLNDTIGASPLLGSGNGAIAVWANSLQYGGPQLSPGTYNFTPNTITNTTAGQQNCARTISGNVFSLTIKPRPTVQWSTNAVTVCQGTSSSFDMIVGNSVLNSVNQNWSVSFTESSGNVNTSCASGASAGIISPNPQTGTGNLTRTFTIPGTLAPGIYTYTLTGINNTTGNCAGTIVGGATITITVNPKLQVTINPDSKELCENVIETFNLTVTNARFCPSIGGSLTNATWTLTTIDSVQANEYTSIYGAAGYGSGNFFANVTVDTAQTLTPNNHMFIASVNSTTPGVCAGNIDTFIAIVEPRPFIEFSTDTVNMCVGGTDSFTINITNALQNGKDQNWFFRYTRAFSTLSGGSCINTGTDLLNGSNIGGHLTVTGTTGDSILKVIVPSTLPVGQHKYAIYNITNSSGPCTGFVLPNDTIIINILPVPSFSLAPDTARVCQGDSTNINFTVTNAQYCVGGSGLTNLSWALYYTQDANLSGTASPSPILGSGNSTFSHKVNSPGTKPVGYYSVIGDSIKAISTVPQCTNTNKDTVVVVVDPRPTVGFSTDTISLCVGSNDSFNINVGNAMLAGAPQNWTLTYTESSGQVSGVSCITATPNIIGGAGNAISGAGDSTIKVYVMGSLPVGMYNYTLTGITNTSQGCNGTIVVDTTITINVYPIPSVDISPDTLQICQYDSADVNFTVTNAMYCSAPNTASNITWELYYNDLADLSGSASYPIVGSGNSNFGYRQNATGTLSPTPGYYKFIADSIRAINVIPYCANTNSDTVIVQINPKPIVGFDSSAFVSDTLDIAYGYASGFDIEVTNAELNGVPQNWSISYKEISAFHDNACAASSSAEQNFMGGTGTNPNLTITGTGNGITSFTVPAYTPAGVYTYILNSITNTSANPNCTGTLRAYDTMVIRVIPKPSVAFSDLSDTICENAQDSFLLTTSATYCVMPGQQGDQLIFFDWTDLIGDTTYTPSLGATENFVFPYSGSPNFTTGFPFDDEGNSSTIVTLNNGNTLAPGVYTWTVDYVGSLAPFTVPLNDSVMSLTYTLTVMPNPIVRFESDTMAVCEGQSDSIVVFVENAQLPANGVNWKVWASENSGNILTSCAQSTDANRTLVPMTFTGNGNQTIKFVIPDTLSPGVYEYILDSIKNTDFNPNCGGTVGTYGKITVFVFPKLELEINPDTTRVCEGDNTPFTLDIINGQYCTAVGSATQNAPYTIYLTDETQSNVFPVPLTGSSVSSYTFTANNSGSLGAGYYKFKTDSLRINITNPINFSCADTMVKDTFVLVVNPEPKVVFDQALIEQCEGDTNTFSFTVSNAMLASDSVRWTVSSVNRETTVAAGCNNAVINPANVLLPTSYSAYGDTTIVIGIPTTLAPGVYRYVLAGIVNTSAKPSACTGTVLTQDTFIIKVYPKPMADVVENEITVCENGRDSITLMVTSAQYCPAIGSSLTNYNWSLYYTDNVASSIPANPLTGLGNFTSKYAVNDLLNLSSGGYTNGVYELTLDSIHNTTHGCKKLLTDTFKLNVNNLPVMAITDYPTNVCKGDVATVTFHIDSLYAGQNWQFNYRINGGSQVLISNSDTGTFTFTTAMLDSVGVNTITFDSILNTTTGCYGNKPFNLSINVLQLPDVDSFVFASTANICSGDTNRYVVRVKNSGGKNWKITYAIGGDTMNWTGTGNGVFSFDIPTQYWQDSMGVNSTRYVVIQRIEWVSPTAAPLCVNNNVTADSASLIVRPNPWISLLTPPNVCVNTPATVNYKIYGMKTGENWTYDWTLTGPANGPNTVNGTGPSVVNGSFTTPNLSPPGTSTLSVYLVTNSTTGCDSAYNWVNNIVVDPPTVPGTLAQSYDVCENSYGPYGFKLTGYVGTIQHWDSSNALTYIWHNIGYAGIDTITRIYPSQGTNYRVIVKSGACPADSSNDVYLKVNPRPFATIVSATDSICEGSSINLVVNVTGVPTSQSWVMNYTNTNPSGKTPTSLTGTGSGQFNFTLSGAGSGFTAGTTVITLTDITNNFKGCDTTLNSTKSVIVKGAPVGGTISPGVDTICTASNGSLTWVPGTGNVAFWQSSASGNPGTWTTIPNSNNNVYNYTNITSTTYFRAVVKNNPCNTADTSAVSKLTVITGPSINAQFVNLPSNNRSCATPTGTVNLTYEVTGTNGNAWTLYILEDDSLHTVTGTGDQSSLTFTTSPGMMTNTFDVTLTKIVVHLGSYSCARGLTNAAVATIKIIDLPVATVNSVTSPICSGTNVTFDYTVSNIKTTESWKLRYTVNGQLDSVTGTGAGTYSVTSAKTGVYTGAGSTTQTVSLVNIENTTTQNTNNENCVNTLSSSKPYTVFSPTVAGTVSHGMANDTVCVGANGNITATTGNGSIIKWESRTWNGTAWSSWTDIANTTGNQGYFTLTNKMEFRAVYQNGPCASATSNVVTVVPKALPVATIALAAGSDTICSGATATMNVTVSNVSYGQEFTITYVEGTSLKTSSLYTQNLTGVHTLVTGSLTNNTTVSLQSISVSSGVPTCANTNLNSTVSIIVQPNPMATLTTVPSRLCQGSTVTFTVNVSNVGTADNWTLNYTLDGVAQTAATGTGAGTFTFTTGSTVTANSDVLALVKITNNSTQDACATNLTDSRTITVDPTTIAGTIGYDTTVCKGGSGFVSEIAASTSGAAIIKWQSRVKGNTSWTDINNTSSTINFYNLNDTTQFRAIYQNGLCASAPSNMITATPRSIPTATITSSDDTICAGAATSFTVSVGNVHTGQAWTLSYVVGSTVKSFSSTGSGSFTINVAAGTFTTTSDITLQSITTSSFVITSPYQTLPGCFNGALNSTQTVTVQMNPMATITSAPSRLCHGATVTFTVNVSSVNTGDNWTLNYTLDGVAQTAATGTGPGSFTFTTGSTVTATTDVLSLTNITNNSTQDACMSTLTSSRTIVVDPTTVAGVIGYDTVVCKGGSGFMTQTAPGVGSIIKWQSRVVGAGSWTDINNTSTTINFYNLNDTTEFRAIYQSGLCAEAASNMRTATPRALPYAVITSSDDTICAGAATSFVINVTNVNVGQAFTVNYVFGSTSRTFSATNNASGNHTITIPTGLLTNTTSITLQSISTSVHTATSPRTPACTNSLNSTQTITVQMNPMASLTTVPSRLCHGSTVTFTVNVSSVNTGDMWTLNYTLDGVPQTAATGTGPGSFTFTTGSTVTATSDVLSLTNITNNSTQDACITTLTDSRTIAVDPTTVAGVIGYDTVVCKGGSGFMSQTAAGVGSIIKWQSRVKGNTAWTDINNTANTIIFYNLNDTTEFRAIYKSGLCSEEASNIRTATPRALPYAVITSTDDTICAGKATTFVINVTNVNVGQAFTVNYVIGSTAKTFSATNNASGNHTISIGAGVLTTTTDITLQSISTSVHTATSPRTPACTNSLNSTQTITVQMNPMASLTTVPSRLCHGSTVTFTVNVSSVNTGDMWTLNYTLDGVAQTAATGTGPGSFTFTTGSTVTATSDVLSLTNITNNSTQDACITTLTDSRTIAVDPTTVAGVIGNDTIVCKGGSGLVFEKTAGVGAIIKWQSRVKGNTAWTDINNTANTIYFFNLNDTTEYRAIYKSGLCNEAGSNVTTATPRPLPTATITAQAATDTICAGQTATLTLDIINVEPGQHYSVTYLEGSVQKVFNSSSSGYSAGPGTKNLTTGALTTTSNIVLQSITTTSGVICASNLTNVAKATITVIDLPFATITSGPDSICQGSSITFTVNVSNVKAGNTWRLIYDLESDADTITGTGPGNFTHTDNDPNTATSAIITLKEILNTGTPHGCLSSNTDDWEIYIFKPTVAGKIEANDTVCKGSNASIKEVTGTIKEGNIIRWESRPASSNTFTQINNTSLKLDVQNLQETTYYRAIYKSGRCDTAISNVIEIVVRELPLATLSGSATVCSGDSTNLTINVTNVAAGQRWVITYLEGVTTKTVSNIGSGAFTLRVGNFLTNTDITLQQIATTTLSPQCLNDKLTNNAKVTVVVNQRPFASIDTVSTRICQNGKGLVRVSVSNVRTNDSWTLTYNVGTSVGLTYSNVGPGTFNLTTPTLSNPGYVNVKLTLIKNNTTTCDSVINTQYDSILVDATTDPGFIIGDTIVCNGSNSGVITQTTGNGSIVRWEYSQDNGSTWTTINNTSTSYTFTNLTKTTLFRTVRRNNTCSEATQTTPVRVTIREIPVATISGSQTICAGQTASLTVTATNTYSEGWNVVYLEGTVIDTLKVSGPLTSQTLITKVLTSNTDITLKKIYMTSGTPQCVNDNLSNNATATVNVNQLPVATIVSGPDSICTGSSATIKISVNNVRTNEAWKVYWSINGGSADSATGTGAGSFDIVTAALTANPSTIRLTRIDNTTTGCFSTLNSTKVIVVDPTTIGGTLSASATVCKGANSGTLVLGSDARGTVIRWEYSEDNGATWTNISNTASSYSYTNLTKTTKYRVMVRSGACASAYSSEVTITVNELPVATVTGSKTICEGNRTWVLYSVTNVSSSQTWEITYLEGSTTKTLTGTGAKSNDTLFTSVLNSTTDITLQSIKITSGAPLCVNNSLVNNATATITVIDNPMVVITSYPKNVCKGDNPAITITVSKVRSTESWTLLYRVNNGANTSTTGVGSGTFSFNIGILNQEGPNGVRFVSITNTGSNPNCTSMLTDSITIMVDSTSLGGSLTGPARVCKGSGGTLTLSGFRGAIQKWQSSTDGTNFFDIANTANTYTFTSQTVKTWYRVVVKNGACPDAFSNVFIVDIQELPTVTIANPTQIICSGSSTTLNLTIGNLSATDTWTITYKENGTNKTVSGTGTSLAWNVGPFTTTTTIELTGIAQTNGLACSNTASDKATITVLQNPKATISSTPDSLCVGSLVNFKVDVSNVRTADAWSLDYEVNGVSGNKKGTGPGSFNINTGIGAATSITTIRLTNIAMTASPFCTSVLNDSATIIVTPQSVGGTLSPSTAVGCAGSATGTLTLSGNVGAVQYWEYSTDGGATWTVTGNKNNTLTYTNLTVTTMYRVFVKSGPCSGAYSATATVTIIPLPTAIVVGSPRVCPGVGARFDITVGNVAATDNWTVRYTVNGGAVQSVTGTGNGTKAITTAGFTYPNTITVKIVNAENTTYGCVNNNIVSQAEGKVTPNPVPAFTANNACADTIVEFKNNSTIAEGTIGGYKWYFGDGDSSMNVSPTHRYKAPGTYTVRLVALSDNSCSAEITKTVTVFANPVANFNTANACLNVDAVFTDASTVSTGNIVAWNWNFGDGKSATTQNATHRYDGAGTYLVTLTVRTNNGCENSITKSITVYTLPDANFVAQPVCQNNAMKFVNASAIGAGTMTFNWDFAGQGTSTLKDPTFTFTGFGTFSVKLLATSNFGCKDSIISDVVVNPNPVASFTADPRCIGEETNFVNTSSVATGSIVEYYWNFGDTTFSGLMNPAHKYARPGSYNVTLRVKSDKGCESTFTGTADVLALPDVQLTANGPTSFCFGDSVTLSANANARTYNWSWSTGTSTAASVVAKTTGWYKVRITAPPIGCANEDSIYITVWDLPTVNAWPGDKVTQNRDTINKGESIQLHATGGVIYNWSPVDYLSNTGIADPMAERMEKTTTYVVNVTDKNGCKNSDTVTIVVIENFKLVVYNVVTPNGDNYNDKWFIDNIWAYPEAEVVIVNRYGMEVYRQTPYDNVNGWDGMYNGKELPDGAYYYIITSPKFPDTVYKGVINLIRTK